MKQEKILIVAAHPDDEILGCGGVISRSARENKQIYVIILGEGVTSRFATRKDGLKSNDLKKIKGAVKEAAKTIGIKKTVTFNFPDNRFDTVPLLDIIKVIEKTKNDVRPDILYTHHPSDLNIDHQITYKAVLTVCRPIAGETVKEIYSFEIPSSTEWNFPNKFMPNVFVDISKDIDRKIKALQCYKTELRPFPHPRSLEAIRHNARRWGSVAGVDYAEAFESVRIIK